VKKLVLKKASDNYVKDRIGYKVQYSELLNPSQYAAVMHNNGAALVVAGAGTGKTRILTFRLSRLVEDGIPPESILLLTFTRKSSAEMLRRASLMLDGRCEKVSGGTFHSFAMTILRQYASQIGYDNTFNVIDSADAEDTINLLRTQMNLATNKKRFPRKETLERIFNLTTNRLMNIEDVIAKDYPFFIEDTESIARLFVEYKKYKKDHNVMDYDDLLLNLLKLLIEKEAVKKELTKKYRYVMVDEYQDTNRLQHRIVLNLVNEFENVMAVGDDAQSIYSFRGAEYRNILEFPKSFKKCETFFIEENYRSSQPILNLTNTIIGASPFKFEKELFTKRLNGELPKIIISEDERQQSVFVAQQILELREMGIELEDIAILFRASYLSFDLEIELSKANIPFKKFGGFKFIETSHVKDLLAFFKIAYNPRDIISWNRILNLIDGVGPRKSQKIIEEMQKMNFINLTKMNFNTAGKENDYVKGLFYLVDKIALKKLSVSEKSAFVTEYYQPLFKSKYDDWQKRWKDIEVFANITERYKSVADFLNDMAIEPPVESVFDIGEESKEDEFVTLSTIHSAKGLEWKAVFLIWALDGRFPSSKSSDDIDALEEERRLFYVALTRAKEELYITFPTNIFDRESGTILSKPSQFLDGIGDDIVDKYTLVNFEENTN
jgi:DNA helicase-2/ATP-dependent DNA helicase PcrA